MKCKNCAFEIIDKNIKTCPKCGNAIEKTKFPVWAIVLIVVAIITLPLLFFIGIVAAFTVPTLLSNTNITKNKVVFKKDLATLNQAILLSQALADKPYTTFDQVWNDGIVQRLNVIKTIQNGVILADNSEIRYEKIKDSCIEVPQNNENITKNTACAILKIDTNSSDNPPNKNYSNDNKDGDIYTVLLYNNGAKPVYNSAEEALLSN